MASPTPYTKRRSPSPSVSPIQPKSKTTGGFFCKSVLLALFLLALPFFPSQAPDFVGETMLTKFWELIHLLFVGIAVAYGLFSRRNVESAVDLRTSRVVDESSLSYVSRIFQVPSFFDDELENSCNFDVRSESHVTASASVVVKERQSESFVVESEMEESSEYGKINQVQAWSSQYFQGRSKVVVARPAYGLDGHVVHQSLGLPVRSLRSALRDNAAPQDNSFSDSYDGTVNGKAESLADEVFDEVMAAPSSPVPWDTIPEMMGMEDDYPSNFQSPSLNETQSETLKSRSSHSTASSSSSSQTSFASHTKNRFSPSRSVSEESSNSNLEESDKEKSLQGSSRSSSPSLPPSPSPKLVTDGDTYRGGSHSRRYSDGSLLEEDVKKEFEDEPEGSKVRGRRTEFFSKKERGSKSLKLAAESSRRGNRPRSWRSFPPDSTTSPILGADDLSTRRRDLQQKSDGGHLIEDSIGKALETDHNNLRVKRGWSQGSLELSAEDEKSSDVLFQPVTAKASRRVMHSSRGNRDTLPERDVTRNSEEDLVELDKSRRKDLADNTKKLKSNSPRCEPQAWRASSKRGWSQDSLELSAEDEKSSESFPAMDVQFQPIVSKASRRAMHSSRGSLPEKDVTRNSEEDLVVLDKLRRKDLADDTKKLKSNSPRCEPQAWRASGKVSLRGKSVRTVRSDRHGKDADSSDDRLEAKAESRGSTKSRRQRQEELSIVLHQENFSETRTKSEPEDDVIEETEAEAELPQVSLVVEEEEAAWESQSNASHDHNEVDRKAGEFIAKFREQIRLQKLASGEQPRGGGTGIIRNSHFR